MILIQKIIIKINKLKKYKYTSSDSLISSFSFFSILSINNNDYEGDENEL